MTLPLLPPLVLKLFENILADFFSLRAVVKWLSKNQYQSNYSCQSQSDQSEFQVIICKLLKAREKSRVQDAVGFGFGFASHWLKNWRLIF